MREAGHQGAVPRTEAQILPAMPTGSGEGAECSQTTPAPRTPASWRLGGQELRPDSPLGHVLERCGEDLPEGNTEGVLVLRHDQPRLHAGDIDTVGQEGSPVAVE